MRPPLARIAAALALVAVLALVGASLRAWGVGFVRISGTSMNDTLQSGDLALVTRRGYSLGGAPEFGQVVECRFPNRRGTYIKRVIGLPGDVIAFQDGGLRRNGAALSEPYVSSLTEDYTVALGGNEYLLLGDNRAESYDSRMEDMGPVGRDAFRGRVRWIVWPLRRFGPVE